MGAAPKNWGLSQPPGAETAPSPRGLGGWGSPRSQPPENRGLGAAPGGWRPDPGDWGTDGSPWRQPERLGAGGKITIEETVFGIMKRNPF